MGIVFIVGLIALFFVARNAQNSIPPLPTLAGGFTLTPRPITNTPENSGTEAAPTLTPTVDTAATNAAATITNLPDVRLATLSEIVGSVRIKNDSMADWLLVDKELSISPGTTVLTDESSSVKISLSEGSVIRLSSQTQFKLVELSGTNRDPFTLSQLDFGKIWTIVSSPFVGQFKIQLPAGTASVSGSFLSAEYNTTDKVEIVTCLEGHCRYENVTGAVDLITNQQTESIDGGLPSSPHAMDKNQIDDWNKQHIPEVSTLTPTRTPTFTPSQTLTPSMTFTPSLTYTPSPTVPTNTPIPTWTASITWTPVPSLTPTRTNTPVTPTVTPGPVSRLVFVTQPPGSINAGGGFGVRVALQDASGVLVPYASANVTISIAANPGGSSLSGTTTVGSSNGYADFINLSLNKSGVGYTLKASAPGLSDGISAAFTVQPGAPASLAIVTSPSSATAGTAFDIQVAARDSFGNTAPGYTGTVHFTSNDSQVSSGSGLPGDYTFTSADGGLKTFSVTLKTAGSRTVTVTDTANGSFTATSAGITINAASAASLSLSGVPSPSKVGTPAPFTVRALDAYGNVATDFNGSVTFAISGSSGTFSPDPYTFNGSEGQHTFTVTFLATSAAPNHATVKVVCQSPCSLPEGSQGGIVVQP